MQMHYILRTGTLVQIVDVLRDHTRTWDHLLQTRYSLMRSIRLGIQHIATTSIVEIHTQLRIP